MAPHGVVRPGVGVQHSATMTPFGIHTGTADLAFILGGIRGIHGIVGDIGIHGTAGTAGDMDIHTGIPPILLTDMVGDGIITGFRTTFTSPILQIITKKEPFVIMGHAVPA